MIKCPNCHKLRHYVIAAITETEYSSMKEDEFVGGMFKATVIKNICIKCLIDAEKIEI
jgi:hypothetical protein